MPVTVAFTACALRTGQLLEPKHHVGSCHGFCRLHLSWPGSCSDCCDSSQVHDHGHGTDSSFPVGRAVGSRCIGGSSPGGDSGSRAARGASPAASAPLSSVVTCWSSALSAAGGPSADTEAAKTTDRAASKKTRTATLALVRLPTPTCRGSEVTDHHAADDDLTYRRSSIRPRLVVAALKLDATGDVLDATVT